MVTDFQTGHSTLSDDIANMENGWYAGLRPVVTLNSNVKISSDGEIIQDVAYKVEHYLQNTDLDTYSIIETENAEGPVNIQVIATPKTYTGFTEDIENINRVISGEIAKDGSLVLKLYYNRDSYPVNLNTNNGTINNGNVTRYTYGIGAKLPTDVSKPGYKFEGWYETNDFTGTVVTEITKTDTGEKTYYAKWSIDENQTKDLNYTVEYYKDNIRVDIDTQVITKKVQLLQPDVVIIDKKSINVTNKYNGYKFDRTDPEKIPNEIDNGGLIKVYYTKANLILTSEVDLSLSNGKGGVKLDWSNYDITNKYFVIYRKKEDEKNFVKIVTLGDKLCANSYIDELGNDKKSPNVPAINIQGQDINSINVKPVSADNGTKYTYYIESYDSIDMRLTDVSNLVVEKNN